MENYIRKIGIKSIVTSVVLLFVGFLMATQSMAVMTSIVLMFGIAIILDGALHCFSYFTIQDDYRFFSYELAQSFIGIILGFAIVINHQNLTLLLPIFLGIWVVIDGIFKLQIALNIRGVRKVDWGIMLLLSMVTIAIGFALILNPAKSMEVALRLSSSIIIITQLINIYDAFYILLEVKENKKNKKKSKTK